MCTANEEGSLLLSRIGVICQSRMLARDNVLPSRRDQTGDHLNGKQQLVGNIPLGMSVEALEIEGIVKVLARNQDYPHYLTAKHPSHMTHKRQTCLSKLSSPSSRIQNPEVQ
jgi:hypothetical protein